MRVPASRQSRSEAEKSVSAQNGGRCVCIARRPCFSIRRNKRKAARGRSISTPRKTVSRLRHSDTETTASSAANEEARVPEIWLRSTSKPLRATIRWAWAMTRYRAAASARDKIEPTKWQVQLEKPRETGPTDKTPSNTINPTPPPSGAAEAAEFLRPFQSPRCSLSPV